MVDDLEQLVEQFEGDQSAGSVDPSAQNARQPASTDGGRDGD